MITKLTAPLRIAPEGQVHPITIPAGEVVTGRAAEVAISMGLAEIVDDKKPPSGKSAGRAPENK